MLWKKTIPFPVKVCVVCGEEFELKPDKPGFANRCPSCSEPEEEHPRPGGDSLAANPEVAAERRRVMRDLLYRKDQ
jgi:hypothetical protein